MKPVMKIFNFLFFCFLLTFSCVNLNAQLIKYVSYFPIPYAYHSEINVSSLSLLATKNGGEVVLGSAAHSGGLVVSDTVDLQDLTVKSASVSTGNPDVFTGTDDSTLFNGYMNAVGDIGIVDPAPKLDSVDAQGIALVRGIYWDGKGGFGRNASGVANWPTSCELQWQDLKIKGSDSYRTYLTCASSVVVDPEKPDPQTVVYKPFTKTIAVAGYCKTGYYVYYNDWSKEYRYNTMNDKEFSYYQYAQSISVSLNSVYDNNCYCAAGSLGSSGGGSGGSIKRPAEDIFTPLAGAATGVKRVGHFKEHDYVFTNTYNLNDCPTNLSEQQICDKNCTGNSCNYTCVKSRTIGTECGLALDSYECFCQKYGCCGLCENGTGQPACGALSCSEGNCCTRSRCGYEESCMGLNQGACGEITQYREYEPTIGNATVLGCTAVIE